MMENGTPSSSSDSEISAKEKKKRRSTLKIQTKMHCLSLKAQDDALL